MHSWGVRDSVGIRTIRWRIVGDTAMHSAGDLESNVEFTFDLRRALVAEDIGAKNTLVDERRCPECSGVMGLSLLLTASQYDAYRVFLRALGVPSAMTLISNADVVMRVCLLIFFISYSVAFYMHGWVDISMGPASTAFFGVFATSLVLYSVERLASRNRFAVSNRWGYYLERFGPSLINRNNFAGPLSAVGAMAIYALVVTGMCIVMLSALTILSYENDIAALVLVCASFASELLYTLARLGRFKGITEQGWAAAYAASLHSSFTTSVSAPTTMVYIVFLLSRDRYA